MSALQRRWAKAKMDALAGGRLEEADETSEETSQPGLAEHGSSSLGGDAAAEPSPSPSSGGAFYSDDDSASSASSASSTGTVVPSASQNLFARPLGPPRQGRTLDPIPWTTFFERELFLDIPSPDGRGGGVVFHAYLTSPADDGPLFVMHHGAGSSGLSFAVLGAEIRKRLPTAGILSLDARDHGLTQVRGDGGGGAGAGAGGAPDLRLSTLSADLLAVLGATMAVMRWPRLPSLVLVGHSLGGAVVTDLAFSGKLDSLASSSSSSATNSSGGRALSAAAATAAASPLLGFAVLDVVEGSAIDALQSMHTYLATRPAGFGTLSAGIEWHLRSRTIRNATSARTSVPALLVNNDDDEEEEKGRKRNERAQVAATASAEGGSEAKEQKKQKEDSSAADREAMPAPPSPAPATTTPDKRRPWRWRTDLGATQPFWEDWFRGLSKKFLGSRGGKLLLLAGTDRLDTELTIGQMQGKYALQVFPEAGHFIHEDLPEKTAVTLVDFYHRNNRGALVLPPKVSELLAQGKKV